MNNDARRYSVLPIRAVGMVRRQYDWRVLAVICSYASPPKAKRTLLRKACR
jgi:hypothetical protein